MAAIMEAVVRLFTHYIFPSGERVLRSGSHAVPEGAEVIKTGASHPAMANWLARNCEWAFRFIPLDLLSEFSDIRPVEGHSKFVTWTQDDRQVVFSLKGKGIMSNIFTTVGLSVLGVVKTPKRLKEMARLSYMWTCNPLVVAEVDHFPHEETDGRGAMKLSAFLKMLDGCYDTATKNRIKYAVLKGKIKTAGFRYHCAQGQLKLEINIVPDHIFGALHGFDVDLAVHRGEWKAEMATTGECFGHAWPKEHTSGPLFGDVQTMSWLRILFPEADVKAWVTAVFAQAMAAVREGVLPKWMDVDLLEDEDGYEYARTTDLQNQAKQYVKWQLWGMEARQSANLVYMAWLSLRQRALSRDIWVPVPYAGRHHVCTRRFVTDLCGYKVKSRPLDVVNFDPRVECLVYSSWLFLKLADDMGGWDQDGDNAGLPLRKVASDVMREGEMAHSAGDIVGFGYRNPNSPGEYSIIKVDADTIPVWFDDLEGIDMPSVSLANRQPFLAEVRAGVQLRELSTPKKGKAPKWSLGFAKKLFAAQKKNPFIGRVANIYMVMAARNITPGWTYPLESMVDACQGSPYEPAFDEIEEWITYGWSLVAEDGKVDRFFAGGWCANGATKKIKGRIPSDVLGDLVQYDGYFTRLHRFIVGEAMAYGEELGKESMAIRARNPIGDGALTEPGFFPSGDDHIKAMVTRGRKLITWSEEQYEAVSRAFPKRKDEFNSRDPENTGPINKARRSEANKEIVRKAVSTLLRIDEADRVTVLVAAYRFCMDDGHNVYGRKDRILYAHAGEEETSVMDLWLDVLARLGYATNEAILYGEMIPIMQEELDKKLAALFNQD
jgi:hypothetical protein